MADPISAGLAVAGGILKGSSSYAAGSYNRDAAYSDAVSAERLGSAQAERINQTGRQAIGEQVAAQGANGFQQGTGSAIDALTQSQINVASDMLNARAAAASRARSLRMQGDIAYATGKNEMVQDLIGAGSSAYKYLTDWGRSGPPQDGA